MAVYRVVEEWTEWKVWYVEAESADEASEALQEAYAAEDSDAVDDKAVFGDGSESTWTAEPIQGDFAHFTVAELRAIAEEGS